MRWFMELSCSINVATVIVGTQGQKSGSAFLGILAYPLTRLLAPPLHQFFPKANLGPRGYFLPLGMCVLLGLFTFGLYRLLAYFLVRESRSPLFAGILNVTSFPVGCLSLYGFWSSSRVGVTLLLAEVIGAAVLVVLYGSRKGHIPWQVGVLIIAVHFALWSWTSGGFTVLRDIARLSGPTQSTIWIPIAETFLLPLLGFFSTSAWGLYVNRLSEVPAKCKTALGH